MIDCLHHLCKRKFIEIIRERLGVSDILYGAYQKFYSALSSLERFSTEANFFDNISSLDTFFSEYRNITFVLQKSIAHTSYRKLYEQARDKHLTDHWFVEKRNETIKQQPFRLIKKIQITLYFPNQKLDVCKKEYHIENDEPIGDYINQFRILFAKTNPIEVFFSAKFSFFENGHDVDLWDKLWAGIYAMKAFMDELYTAIEEKSEACEKLRYNIERCLCKLYPRDFIFAYDYAYYHTQNKFERAETSVVTTFKQLRLPINCLNKFKVGDWLKTPFDLFVFMNVIIGSTDIMTTFLIMYEDDTFTIDLFQSSIKTTFYRKLNELAELISIEKIKAVFIEHIYMILPVLKGDEMGFTSKERIRLATSEFMNFVSIDKDLNVFEINFKGEKIKVRDRAYIYKQITSNKMNYLLYSKNNMQPIIEAFKKKKNL